MEIGFKGGDFVDAYKVYVDPNPDLATIAILTLQNHLVMAPMTRNRAADNIPTALMAESYAQRAAVTFAIGSPGLRRTRNTAGEKQCRVLEAS